MIPPWRFLSMPKNSCADLIFVRTRLESYSNMPISNIATTLNCLIFGSIPIGPISPRGDTILILSFMKTTRLDASSFPNMIPGISPSPESFEKSPSFIWERISVVCDSLSGSIPLIKTPCVLLPEDTITCPRTNGAYEIMSFSPFSFSAVCSYDCMAPL